MHMALMPNPAVAPGRMVLWGNGGTPAPRCHFSRAFAGRCQAPGRSLQTLTPTTHENRDHLATPQHRVLAADRAAAGRRRPGALGGQRPRRRRPAQRPVGRRPGQHCLQRGPHQRHGPRPVAGPQERIGEKAQGRGGKGPGQPN